MKNLINYKSIFKILSKGRVGLLVSAFLAGISTQALAAPTGGVVTSGSATISQSGSTTNINQTTQKATINWQNFSIAQNETVNFNQPNVNSITLNRVVGNERSIIDGALNANGQVWILNSNGILFNSTARINTAGILATTKDITDTDFQAGNYKFSGESTASIINMGTIEASDSGYVAMLANTVQNDGTIKAYKGTVHLTGASEATINLNGNSIVSLTVEKGVLDALVENKNIIQADGGKIYLTTNAVDELLKGVVNNTGIIEAKSLDDVSSEVILFAHGGMANIAGSIDATGGFVETSGKDFIIDKNTQIKAKTWLIDPANLTVSDATAYETSLNAGTNTLIQTNNTSGSDEGNIYINDTIDWTTTAKLTLDAYKNIYINSAITANSGGQLAFYYGQGALNASNTSNYYVNAKVNLSAGDNFFTKLGSDVTEKTYKVITSLGSEGSTTGTDLQGINGNLTGNYVLGTDIFASSTSTWENGAGFKSIIGEVTYINRNDQSVISKSQYDTLTGMDRMNYMQQQHFFSGMFDGLGHTISNMTINRPSDNNYVGLFSTISGATIQNLGLINVNFHNNSLAGGIAGTAQNSNISNSYVTGVITANTNSAGGLVGDFSGSKILNSYSTANVSGGNCVGGLVGNLSNNSSITNSYTAGEVYGNSSGWAIGGLVGNQGGNIDNSYSMGKVYGTGSYLGGLIGKYYSGTTTNSFWNTQTSGQSTSARGTGITTAEFANASTFNGWDTNIWSLSSAGSAGKGYEIAFLRPYLTTLGKDVALQTSTTLFAGGYGTSANPYTITTAAQLQNMNNSNVVSQSYYYNLSNNIDLYGVTWTPIGNSTTKFTGTFDGLNHTIDRLVINRLSTDNIGLFGYTNNATIKNIGITNANVKGGGEVGTIIGRSTNSSLLNSYASGVLEGNGGADIGGLVGYNENSSIDGSNSSVTVAGTISVGGLVGSSHGTISNSYSTGNVLSSGFNTGGFIGYNQGTITNAYATGTVGSTADKIGGFVGINNAGGNISLSYATGTVTASNSSNIGGFAGANISSTISSSYARGSVIGDTFVGGLVGRNENTISNSYATGGVSGTQYIGGLTGANLGTISNSYATGSVRGSSDFGGLSGYNNYVVLNSFWNTATSGTNVGIGSGNTSGATGKTTAELQKIATYTTDITDVNARWNIATDSTLDKTQILYPILITNNGVTSWVMPLYTTLLTYNLGTKNSTYTGRDQSLSSFWTNSIFGTAGSSLVAGTDYKFVYNSTDITSFKNVGTYNGITVELLNADYEIDSSGTNSNGTLTIAKANATVTANSDTSKVYNGQVQSVTGFSATGLVNNETISVLDGVSGATASGTNAGTYSTALAGTDENYNLTFENGTLTIAKADLTVSGATASNKVYDATNTATVTGGVVTAFFGDRVILSAANATFVDKNVGTAKAITTAYTISGTDADNYNLIQQAGLTADIVPLVDYAIISSVQTVPQNNIANIATQDIRSATVVSTVTEGKPTERVTLSQLQQTQTSQESSSNEVKDVKIALSETSLVSIVNGGVNLPSGVDQEFYVVKANSQAAGAN